MSNGKYILDDAGNPKSCDDAIEWAEWMEKADRRVALTEFDGGRVSTVFLGIDHAFGLAAPLLYETMIFGGPHSEEQWRYRTREAALAGHADAVALAAGASTKPSPEIVR